MGLDWDTGGSDFSESSIDGDLEEGGGLLGTTSSLV